MNQDNIRDIQKLSTDEIKKYVESLSSAEFKIFKEYFKKLDPKRNLEIASHYQSFKNTKTLKENNSKDKLSLDDILPNPMQPRKNMQEDAVQNRMQSIEERGLLSPIGVYKNNKSEYVLIYGQIRLEAYKRLHKREVEEGIKPSDFKYARIKVVIIDKSDYDAFDFSIDALTENLNRDSMSAIDTAESIDVAFNMQKEKDGKNGNPITSARAFAHMIGVSNAYISYALKVVASRDSDPEFYNYAKEKNIESLRALKDIVSQQIPSKEKIKILDDVLNGDIKIAQIKKVVAESYGDKTEDHKEISLIDKIFTFKKSFDVKKYKKLEEDKKRMIDNNLEKIKALQDEIEAQLGN